MCVTQSKLYNWLIYFYFNFISFFAFFMYEWAKVAFVTEIDGVIFIKCREQKKSATQKQEWSAQDFFFPHSQIDLTMPGNWKFDCFFFFSRCVHSPINANSKWTLSKVILLFAIRFSIYFLVNFPEHYLTKWKKNHIRINHSAKEYTHSHKHSEIFRSNAQGPQKEAT